MEDVRATMEGKFWGAWRVARSADIRPGGSLTLVSGFLSIRPRPNSAIVGAANGALELLARSLALELAPVRVNCVSPGIIDTPIRAAMPEAARLDMLAKTAAALPVGRVGIGEDIARQILAFMTIGFATGSIVYLDGGALVTLNAGRESRIPDDAKSPKAGCGRTRRRRARRGAFGGRTGARAAACPSTSRCWKNRREAEAGGNTRWSPSYMRLDAPDRIAPGFEDDMPEASGGLADPGYFRTLAENAPATIGWLQGHGVEFITPVYYLSAGPPRIQPVGGGRAIVERLAEAARKRRREISLPIRGDATGDGGGASRQRHRAFNRTTASPRRSMPMPSSSPPAAFRAMPTMMRTHFGAARRDRSS